MSLGSIYKMFNVKLRRMRKKFKLTQAQLAKKLGISPSTVGMYEQGRREPDSAMLLKIANLFSVSVDFFLESKEMKRRVKNAEEIVNRIKLILKGNSGLKKENLSKETIEEIAEAVKKGLQDALKDDD